MYVRPVTSTKLLVAALFSLGLASSGCFTRTTLDVAQARAAQLGSPSCKPSVRQRHDLYSDDASDVFEITGCGVDKLIACTAGHWQSYTADDGTISNSPVGAACQDTNWCTPDGCDSYELAARRTFAVAKSCPLNRVTAKSHARVIPAAPPEIAADPQRLEMWQTTHEQQIAGRYFWAASGCDVDAVLECIKPPGVRAIPMCSPSLEAPAP